MGVIHAGGGSAKTIATASARSCATNAESWVRTILATFNSRMHRVTYAATAKVPKHANKAMVHVSHGLANEARIPGAESWRLGIEPHLIEIEPSLSDRRKACIGRAGLISTVQSLAAPYEQVPFS